MQSQGNSPDKKNFVNRTKSLFVDSFKLGNSFFGHQGAKKIIVDLNLPDLQLVQKQDYLKQNQCQVCFCKFGKLARQHHCRICANAVCSSCSPSTINKQRTCDVCAYKYSHNDKQMKKGQIITNLKKIAKNYISMKNQVESKIKQIQSQIPNENTLKLQKQAHQRKLMELNGKLNSLREQRTKIQQELEQIKSA